MTKDMTVGTEWKVILPFTLPLIAGNLLQQVYSLADSMVAGNLVSETALAAIGVCFPFTFLLLAAATGLSNGCGVITAQFFGAGDEKSVRRSVSTALLTALGAGILITLIGSLAARPVLTLVLNTPETVLPDALSYIRIYCIGLVFQFVYNTAASILRALGDSRATLYFLVAAAVLNVGLDIFLAPYFGVAGIAWATDIAQAVCCMLSLIYLFQRISILKFSRGEFVMDPQMFRLSMKMGIPTILQQCSVGLGMILMQRLINSFGDTAIAATSASQKVESFIMVPIMMFYQGLSNFTGQNIGAGKLERVRRGYRQTLVMTLLCCVVIIAVILLFTDQIIALFGLTAEGIALGRGYLRVLSYFFVIFAVMYATNGVLQGAGDVMFPTLGSLTSLTVRVISANLLAAFTPVGYASVYICNPIGWVAGTAIVLTRYFSGAWKKKALVQ